jgi:hypothetical protein
MTRLERESAGTKVKAGDIVQFDMPIEFVNGVTLSELRYEKGSKFRALEINMAGAYTGYHIINWRRFGWTVITKAEEGESNE